MDSSCKMNSFMDDERRGIKMKDYPVLLQTV